MSTPETLYSLFRQAEDADLAVSSAEARAEAAWRTYNKAIRDALRAEFPTIDFMAGDLLWMESPHWVEFSFDPATEWFEVQGFTHGAEEGEYEVVRSEVSWSAALASVPECPAFVAFLRAAGK